MSKASALIQFFETVQTIPTNSRGMLNRAKVNAAWSQAEKAIIADGATPDEAKALVSATYAVACKARFKQQ